LSKKKNALIKKKAAGTGRKKCRGEEANRERTLEGAEQLLIREKIKQPWREC